MQITRPLSGNPITQAFGLPAPGVASYEPAGTWQRDAGGFLRRRAYMGSPPAGWSSSLHFHDGLDIKAPLGTPILAPLAGTIVRCRAVAQAGATDANRYLAIRVAPNVAVYYWHLDDWASSSEGKVVRAGDVIAHVGNSGLSTGPHTHMELRRLVDGLEIKWNPQRVFIGGDLEITADGRIVPMVVVPSPKPTYRLVRRETISPPRPFNIGAKTIAIWDPDRPGAPVGTFTGPTASRVSERLGIEWDDEAHRTPNGYSFVRIDVGAPYAGMLLVESDGFVVDPVAAPPPAPEAPTPPLPVIPAAATAGPIQPSKPRPPKLPGGIEII